MTTTEISPGVWDIDLVGGQRAVAKVQPYAAVTRGRNDDVLTVERKVLNLLRGCPVPRILGTDPEAGIIYFEHVGETTLDEAVRVVDLPQRRNLGNQLVTGFCQIEKELSVCQSELNAHVSSAACRNRLSEVAERTRAVAHTGLTGLVPEVRQRQVMASRLDAICDRLNHVPPTLGSTDYNARNVVVDNDKNTITFIEFAKIGWDWPERRLVQYGTGLGVQQPGGFVGVIDRDVVSHYAQATPENLAQRAFALDGHHLLFHLVAAAKLLEALTQPDRSKNRHLLNTWQQPLLRLKQLREALSLELADDPLTHGFRRQFAATTRSRKKRRTYDRI